MLSDVMNHYGLAREFSNTGFTAGYFETEHLNQLCRNVCATIYSGGLIALTGPLGSGKTVAVLRIRQALQKDQDGKVIVSRSVAMDKDRITLGFLIEALFYDLSSKKEVKIPTRGERRERELLGLFKQVRRPVALFVDDAHLLNWNTLWGLKRLMETIRDDGGTLAIVLAGQSKLKNELLKPRLEEVGYRATFYELHGIRDSKREYVEWLLRMCAKGGVNPHDIMYVEAMDLLAERLTTALEIESNLTRALEAAYLIGEKPVTMQVVESIVPTPITDWEAILIRNGYDLKDLAALLTAKPKEIKLLLRGELEPARTDELRAQLRAAGLPVPDLSEANEVSEEHKEDNKKETKR